LREPRRLLVSVVASPERGEAIQEPAVQPGSPRPLRGLAMNGMATARCAVSR
jgi:hypothetical protein